MEIKNFAVTSFGGLTIENECQSTPDGERYLTVIGCGDKTIFEGSPGSLEAMCISHQMLIDACKQIISGIVFSKSVVIVSDHAEFKNGIDSAMKALLHI